MRTTMDRSNLWAWGHQVWWGSQGGKKKRKERGWAKKHQGRVREVSKYVQVFCSPFFSFLFFNNERFKTWRLVDCHSVICKAREKVGNRGLGAKGTQWGVSRLVLRPVEPKVVDILGGFHSAALTCWICNTFLYKIVFYQILLKSMELNFDLPTPKMVCPSPHAAVGDCSKTQCIYKALSFCLQTKHA